MFPGSSWICILSETFPSCYRTTQRLTCVDSSVVMVFWDDDELAACVDPDTESVGAFKGEGRTVSSQRSKATAAAWAVKRVCAVYLFISSWWELPWQPSTEAQVGRHIILVWLHTTVQESPPAPPTGRAPNTPLWLTAALISLAHSFGPAQVSGCVNFYCQVHVHVCSEKTA